MVKAKNEKELPLSKMGKLLEEGTVVPVIGDTVEGPVISITRHAVHIDLFPYGTGIIYGKEYINARDVIKKVNVGDKISAKVVDLNNPDGYI